MYDTVLCLSEVTATLPLYQTQRYRSCSPSLYRNAYRWTVFCPSEVTVTVPYCVRVYDTVLSPGKVTITLVVLCTSVRHCALPRWNNDHFIAWNYIHVCNTVVMWPSLYRMELCTRVRHCAKVTITLSHGAVYNWWQITTVRPTQQITRLLCCTARVGRLQLVRAVCTLYGPSLSTRNYNTLIHSLAFMLPVPNFLSPSLHIVTLDSLSSCRGHWGGQVHHPLEVSRQVHLPAEVSGQVHLAAEVSGQVHLPV